jgi:hypothetical protein
VSGNARQQKGTNVDDTGNVQERKREEELGAPSCKELFHESNATSRIGELLCHCYQTALISD